jgi:hypothetical protein
MKTYRYNKRGDCCPLAYQFEIEEANLKEIIFNSNNEFLKAHWSVLRLQKHQIQ